MVPDSHASGTAGSATAEYPANGHRQPLLREPDWVVVPIAPGPAIALLQGLVRVRPSCRGSMARSVNSVHFAYCAQWWRSS
jgi:hypothetical protein